ncbi:hypothetical protein [Vibrio sp. AND4]|uniref:hypothetical protein n=1 Tax=Vibrio sp. AND4 TaxID=314289 RepID=UPI00015EFE51|nr:hypothetical protein [Vibrio sp. AND4]EDP59431.1 hypothetical protein AND4_09667 [Vibrio sp. AND4]
MIETLVLPKTGETLINVPSNLETLTELGFSTTEAEDILSAENLRQQRETMLHKRKAAYKKESDPLFMEWQFDGSTDSEHAWRSKVEEIKSRYPLPELT